MTGIIRKDSPEYEAMSALERTIRSNLEQENKAKIANPNFVVSKTRLTIRNLPLLVDEKELKEMFIKSLKAKYPKTPFKILQVRFRPPCLHATEIRPL